MVMKLSGTVCEAALHGLAQWVRRLVLRRDKPAGSACYLLAVVKW